jgi:hypothetical protein
MIASAMEDLAQLLLEQGEPLPRPDSAASAENAAFIKGTDAFS